MAEQITLQRTSVEALFERLQTNKRPVLINALQKEAYMGKRIPGSVNIPAEKSEWVENIVPDKDQDMVVYCANADCPASANLAKALIEKGYTRVWDFEEGLAGWEEAGYELVGNNVS